MRTNRNCGWIRITPLALTLLLLDLSCGRSAQSYLDRGNRFFDEGNYADAALQYQKATQQNPKWGEAYYRWGLAEMRKQQGPAAIQALANAVRLAPDHEAAKALLADLDLNAFLANPHGPRVFYDEAVKLTGELLAANPGSFDALRLKGALALLDSKPQEAIDFLRRANQVKPMQHDVVLSLSQALFQTGQAAEGEDLARQLIAREKDFGPMYDALYRRYSAANRATDAERILEQKSAANPKVSSYRLDLAGHYARVRKRAEMTGTLQALLDNRRDFPQARLLVGNFYSELGEWAQALAYFEEGARSEPEQRKSYAKRAVAALIALGKRDDALRLLDKLVAEDPKDIEGRSLRANLWLQSGLAQQTQAAIKVYEELVKENAASPRLHYDLGKAYLAGNEPGAARLQLQEAVRRRGDFLEAQLLLAELSLSQGNGEDALRIADEILARRDAHPGARLLRAAGMVALGRLGEARAELTRLDLTFPNHPQVKVEWGILALAEKKYSEAERIFSQLYSSGGDLRPAAALIEVYSAQNRMETALQFVNKAFKQSPDSAALRRLLAIANARAGKFDQAIAEYEWLARNDPGSLETLLRLGDAYRANRDSERAIAKFREALRLAPKNTDAEILLAETLMMAGSNEAARVHYETVLKRSPGSPAVKNNVAYLICETGGDLAEALVLAQQAIQTDPRRRDFADTLGWVYLKQKNTRAALQIFERLLREDPKNATFHYHAALALLGKGDTKRAVSELEAALTNRPEKQEEQRIRELLRKIL